MSAGELLKTSRSLGAYVLDICDYIGLSFPQLARDIGVHSDLLWKELRNDRGARAELVSQVADRLDVTLDALILRRVDVRKLLLRREGRLPLPERYKVGALGTVRTALPALNYIRKHKGEKLYRYLLRELDLTETLLKDPTVHVSIRLLNDIFEVLHRRGFDENDFFTMGCEVTRVPENEMIAKSFRQIKSHNQVYEYLVENVTRFYEKNFEYHLKKSTPSSVIVEVRPRPELVEAFKSPIVDSRFTAVYRQGIGAFHPLYSKLRPTRIHERSCVHLGDSKMLFEMSWA